MFSDPKYSFSVCQKYFFSVSKKVSIFHRIQPKYKFSYLIKSNTSGLSFSLSFILSFMAMMMVLALSSAPCLELFSAAPDKVPTSVLLY